MPYRCAWRAVRGNARVDPWDARVRWPRKLTAAGLEQRDGARVLDRRPEPGWLDLVRHPVAVEPRASDEAEGPVRNRRRVRPG